MSESYDVIVIGGGPGGSTISTILAQAGKKVLLLEREHFPRYHIGESLLSGTADLMKKIGVLEKMEQAKFVKKHGVSWIWGAKREPWTVYFKDALAMPYDYGYQVERGPFDKMLLDNAREHGVEALEGHRVIDVVWDEGRVAGVVYESEGGNRQTASAPWTIDASGQSNFITRLVAQKNWDEKLANMALWNYWKGAARPGGIDAGNTFLPTFSDGWWWFIPLRDEITSIGVVLDRENFAAAKDKGFEPYYLDAISRTPELSERLRSAEMTDEMRVTKDWSYIYDRFCGKGFMAVGDAACFIDPLLSTGVHLAMLSGYLGGVTINTLLSDSPADDKPILDFYQEQYASEFKRLKDQIYFLYGGHRSPDSYFWHARKAMDMPGASPKAAFVSLIAGAYEHRSWYRRFLSNLDVPEQVKQLAEGIFHGETAGAQMVSTETPLALNPAWQKQSSYAINGLRLQPSEILTPGGGLSLPLTDGMRRILSTVDGRMNSLQIVDSLVNGDEKERDALRATLNEAITHKVLVPSEAQA